MQKSLRVTLIVLCYNQERYISQSVKSALDQDYDNLQVIISDDASTDSTWDVIQAVLRDYSGAHAVILNRNVENVGITAHINTVFELADGELFVFLAGDDISLNNRVKTIAEYYKKNEASTLFVSTADLIDEEGELARTRYYDLARAPTSLDRLNDSWILGAVFAYHRSVYDVFGKLMLGGMYEDIALARRALLLGESCLIEDTLVKYRVHGTNISSMLCDDRQLGAKKLNYSQASNVQLLVDHAHYINTTKTIDGYYLGQYVALAYRIIAFHYMNKLKVVDIIHMPFVITSAFRIFGFKWLPVIMKTIARRFRNS